MFSLPASGSSLFVKWEVGCYDLFPNEQFLRLRAVNLDMIDYTIDLIPPLL